MALFGKSPTPKTGDRAPDFTLPDHHGNAVKLSDFLGKKPVILAFYPRASTPGCTQEITAYGREIAKFEAAGAQVLGISLDTQERNRKFAEQAGANFPLLCDTEKRVAKAYGVLHFTHLFANRVTFVIDKDGIIRHIDEGSKALDPLNAHQACAMHTK